MRRNTNNPCTLEERGINLDELYVQHAQAVSKKDIGEYRITEDDVIIIVNVMLMLTGDHDSRWNGVHILALFIANAGSLVLDQDTVDTEGRPMTYAAWTTAISKLNQEMLQKDHHLSIEVDRQKKVNGHTTTYSLYLND